MRMSLVKVQESDYVNGSVRPEEQCRLLEEGNILFFDRQPFEIETGDIEFLLSAKQSNTRLHKNISYRPEKKIIRGFPKSDQALYDRLCSAMHDFSARATEFLAGFLSPYASRWLLDYASFRPIEEAGRDLPL